MLLHSVHCTLLEHCISSLIPGVHDVFVNHSQANSSQRQCCSVGCDAENGWVWQHHRYSVPCDEHTHAGSARHWQEDDQHQTHRLSEPAELKYVSISKDKCMYKSETMALANSWLKFRGKETNKWFYFTNKFCDSHPYMTVTLKYLMCISRCPADNLCVSQVIRDSQKRCWNSSLEYVGTKRHPECAEKGKTVLLQTTYRQ